MTEVDFGQLLALIETVQFAIENHQGNAQVSLGQRETAKSPKTHSNSPAACHYVKFQ